MLSLKIILGSTRPGRFGIQPAKWFYEIARKRQDIDVELIDLEVIALPFLDEPIPPSRHQYSKEHTRSWSATISGADAFVFVTAEYNHSIPASLKNAIDYLYDEWNYKPASFVSYGSLAGGARSVEQLREICGEIKIYDLREQLMFPNYYDHLNEKGEYVFTAEQEVMANKILDNLLAWAQVMKDYREKIKEPEEM